MRDETQDTITGCTHLGGGPVADLEACKALTCQNNGNAFNYKNGNCYYKQCENNNLILMKGTTHGGWNVYGLDLDG